MLDSLQVACHHASMKDFKPRLPATDSERARWTRFTFMLHLRPVKVAASTLRWTHTFGLGGSGLVLLILLVMTGVLQMLVYQPVPDVAYDSVLALEHDVAFGPLVRGVHYWSANLLILVLLMHAARTFLTGGHRGQRSFTWVLGIGLLAGVLAAGFTGYLLPWDQRSYWAVTISTGMLTYFPVCGDLLRKVVLGGNEIADTTLVNFYTLHTTIIPVTLLLLAAWHFWRVRRAGGVIEPPPVDSSTPANATMESERVMFWPHLMVREIVQSLVIVAIVLTLAAVLGAPLGERANPGMSPNPAKAPWYFMGFQELLIHFHPVFAVLVLPVLAFLGLLALPYLTPAADTAGRWFLSPLGKRSAALAAVAACGLVPLLVVLDERAGSGAKNWILGGLLPLLVMIVFGWFWMMVLRKRGAPAPESIQAVVVLVVVAFLILTLVGVWFRGAGMALVWPWTGGGG